MPNTDLAALVDPMIGTLGLGFTFPGAVVPFGMVQLSPDTESLFAYSGYLHSDQLIRGFSHVHIESIGVQGGGDLPFMPTTGPVTSTDVMDYQSRFSHLGERASAGHYRVHLDDYGVDVELTAGPRTGMHRYHFGGHARGNVLLDIGRHIPGGGIRPAMPTDSSAIQNVPGAVLAEVTIDLATRTVTGTANVDRSEPHGYAVHVAARFDQPFASAGTWSGRGEPVAEGSTQASGIGAGAVVSFDTAAAATVTVKVGISFVSVEKALLNLESELPGEDFDFDAHVARARAAWNAALARIEVEGGTHEQRVAFTTALYHAQLHPNILSDVDGSYLGHDHQPHRIGDPGDPMPAGSTYYGNFSLWDTYRGPHQLQSLIVADRVRDMARSLHAIAVHGGRLPRWSLMSTYPDWMPGRPALQIVAETHARGLIPDELVEPLYEAAVALAFDDDASDPYAQLGYVPYDADRGGASMTLENAIGDFALAQMAHRLGRDEDRDRLLERAQSWRNVIDPTSGFARPRLSDGSWLWSQHAPGLLEGFVEGSGWQYTWLVPHDVAGLVERIGGHQAAVERLDTFFTNLLRRPRSRMTAELAGQVGLSSATYWGNQYDPSNEHDLQAPYLYAWAGQPWKTQALMRELQQIFTATPDGLPGNDDLGTMSTWLIFSALGLYPVISGAPLYVLGSPLFDRAVIHGEDGDITVTAPGASFERRYITGARVGGRELDGAWCTHAELAAAGGIDLTLSPQPDASWGTNPPPSQSVSELAAFG